MSSTDVITILIHLMTIGHKTKTDYYSIANRSIVHCRSAICPKNHFRTASSFFLVETHFRECCSMIVIDSIQTCQFVKGIEKRLGFVLKSMRFILENSERFLLYGLCGALLGIVFILMTVIFVLHLEIQSVFTNDNHSARLVIDSNQIQNYLPVYRYNDRIQEDFYLT